MNLIDFCLYSRGAKGEKQEVKVSRTKVKVFLRVNANVLIINTFGLELIRFMNIQALSL